MTGTPVRVPAIDWAPTGNPQVAARIGAGLQPPPFKPDLNAIRWIEDPHHGPSRPRTWRCRLIFWRPCPHREDGP